MSQFQNRRFSSDEVSAIVRRALQDQNAGDSVSYEELRDIAGQSGIAPEILERVLTRDASEGALDRAGDEWMRQRRGKFNRHLRSYLIVNGILMLINLRNGGAYWFIWPVLGWGFGLAFDASATFWPAQQSIERGARKILRKQKKQG